MISQDMHRSGGQTNHINDEAPVSEKNGRRDVVPICFTPIVFNTNAEEIDDNDSTKQCQLPAPCVIQAYSHLRRYCAVRTWAARGRSGLSVPEAPRCWATLQDEDGHRDAVRHLTATTQRLDAKHLGILVFI